MRPRIGITSTPRPSADGPVDAVERAYIDAVLAAGGLPLVLPVLAPEDVPEVRASLDGLLLTGGGDVGTAAYGAVPSPLTGGVDERRDAWELALVRDAGLPALAVCRGAQVVAVAYGGTLVQDLEEAGLPGHGADDRPADEVHEVELAAGSLVRSVLGVGSLRTNSLHHQAVATVGAGLRVTGRAPDGVVEAFESDDGRVLAVQWHPELLAHRAADAALFAWLIEYAYP